jgi:multiple sugar transport system permease protein
MSTTLAKVAATPVVARAHRARSKVWRRIGMGVFYIALTAVAIFCITPMVWMLLGSFKYDSEILAYPPTFLPKYWLYQNYVRATTLIPMGRWFLNSVILAAITELSVLTTASLAGYAFAHLEFRLKRVLFLSILGTMMIPFFTIMIPLFLMVSRLKLLNTYLGMVLPGLVSAYGIFLMRQFMSTIPTELLEAARIDGSSEFRIWAEIIIPNSRPALGTLALFTFLGSWDSFTWPLVIVNQRPMKPIALGLVEFTGQLAFETKYGTLLAASSIAVVPVLIVFILAQEQIIESFHLSGLKG